MSIKLSITVITYNQEHFIRETLDSILNQDISHDYEILIGDDASRDHCTTPQTSPILILKSFFEIFRIYLINI